MSEVTTYLVGFVSGLLGVCVVWTRAWETFKDLSR